LLDTMLVDSGTN